MGSGYPLRRYQSGQDANGNLDAIELSANPTRKVDRAASVDSI